MHDYIAAAEFMYYKKKWIPRQIAFARQQDLYVIQPALWTFDKFIYEEIVLNNQLPKTPFRHIEKSGKVINVPVDEFDKYLTFKFLKDIGHDKTVSIGATDMATLMYLLPLYPNCCVTLLNQHHDDVALKVKNQ